MSKRPENETPTLEQLRATYKALDLCGDCERTRFVDWLKVILGAAWSVEVEEAFGDPTSVPPPWLLDHNTEMIAVNPMRCDSEELRDVAAQDCAGLGAELEGDQFGACPECNTSDGHLNIERNHWGVCHAHKTKWFIGRDLFDEWKQETAETWDKNEQVLATYREVDETPQQ